MPTVTLSADTLHRIAALSAFTSRNAMTPILHGVQVSVAGGELRAVATDRYAVARIAVPHDDENAELPAVVIPTSALSDALKASKGRHTVTLTADADGPVIIEWGAGSLTVESIGGNFPPVDRLYSHELTDLPAGTPINSTFLARLAKLTAPARKPADRTVPFALSASGANLHASGDAYEVLICPVRVR